MAPERIRLRWLITGATGLLGANLGAFLRPHHTTIAMTRSGAPEHLFDEAVQGDLRDFRELVAALRATQPDVVLHAAAMASHEACESDPHAANRINARATGILAKAAAEAGARFVYISTDAVFDGERGNYTEGDVPNPTSVYGRTKLEGEQQAAEATDALIIRTNFFGWSPTGTRSILEFFVNELDAGRHVRGFTDFSTTSAYTQTLAATIMTLVDEKATGVFHVTSPDPMTKYQFGVAVAKEFGLDPSLITPARADIHPPRAGDISLDVTKVQRVLRQPLPTQIEGIARAHRDAPDLSVALRRTLTP